MVTVLCIVLALVLLAAGEDRRRVNERARHWRDLWARALDENTRLRVELAKYERRGPYR